MRIDGPTTDIELTDLESEEAREAAVRARDIHGRWSDDQLDVHVIQNDLIIGKGLDPMDAIIDRLKEQSDDEYKSPRRKAAATRVCKKVRSERDELVAEMRQAA